MNNSYDWWRKNKPAFNLIPMTVFWLSSMIFFIVGLSFDNPMVIFGKDISVAIAVALSISITFIQITGNEEKNMDTMEKAVWLASYALGIGTNVYGLSIVLNISNQNFDQ